MGCTGALLHGRGGAGVANASAPLTHCQSLRLREYCTSQLARAADPILQRGNTSTAASCGRLVAVMKRAAARLLRAQQTQACSQAVRSTVRSDQPCYTSIGS